MSLPGFNHRAAQVDESLRLRVLATQDFPDTLAIHGVDPDLTREVRHLTAEAVQATAMALASCFLLFGALP